MAHRSKQGLMIVDWIAPVTGTDSHQSLDAGSPLEFTAIRNSARGCVFLRTFQRKSKPGCPGDDRSDNPLRTSDPTSQRRSTTSLKTAPATDPVCSTPVTDQLSSREIPRGCTTRTGSPSTSHRYASPLKAPAPGPARPGDPILAERSRGNGACRPPCSHPVRPPGGSGPAQ